MFHNRKILNEIEIDFNPAVGDYLFLEKKEGKRRKRGQAKKQPAPVPVTRKRHTPAFGHPSQEGRSLTEWWYIVYLPVTQTPLFYLLFFVLLRVLRG